MIRSGMLLSKTPMPQRRESRGRGRTPKVTRATSGVAVEGTQVRAASHWKELNEPCHIWANGDKSVRVENHGGEVSLEKYMKLPVHQYYVLDPNLITSLGEDSFEFNVPKLQLFNEWIQPNVVATVNVNEKDVHILTKECSMTVSDMIHSMNLDQQWYMMFESKLTWENDCTASDKERRGFERAAMRSNGASSGKSYGMMHGASRVDVWCELAPGFTFMPRDVLENACNLALTTLMQSLLPIFMTQLSEDYQRWATDTDYRRDRMKWNIDRFRQKIG